MSSIDTLAAAVRTALEQVRLAAVRAMATRQVADELRAGFEQVGTEDKSRGLKAVIDSLEAEQAQVAAATDRIESALALTEALRASGGARATGGTPSSPPPAPSGWHSSPEHAAARDGMTRLGAVDTGRRVHILDGDGDGVNGGHRWDSEIPDKTKFPRSWSDDQVIAAVSDIASNPDVPPRPRRRGGWICEGTRNQVTIEVVTNRDGGVWTGYPLSGPGVERNRGEW